MSFNRDRTLATLIEGAPVIAPSMLKCDFANLQREVELLEQADARVLHWDVMDGHFVPNLSYGSVVLKELRKATSLIFDAHLMISEPERYLDDYFQAGCDCITVHIEAVPEPGSLLERIRDEGVVSGLAINPGTPIEVIEDYLELCDQVLVMSVEPGFGGQQFMPIALKKLSVLKEKLGLEKLLSVDGGIGLNTIAKTAEAGANVFVCGSSIFDAVCYSEAMTGLRECASAAYC